MSGRSQTTRKAPTPRPFTVILLDAGSSGVGCWRECLFSLTAQAQPGLRLVVVLDRDSHHLRDEIHAELSAEPVRDRYRHEILLSGHASDEIPALVLEGLGVAPSGDVAVIGSDAVVYPEHLSRLASALALSATPWAWVRAKVAAARRVPEGELYLESKRDHPVGDAFDPGALLFHSTSLYGVAAHARTWKAALTRLPPKATREAVLWEFARFGVPTFRPAPASIERRLPLGSAEWLDLNRTDPLAMIAERLGTYPDRQLAISVRDLIRWGAEVEAQTIRMRGPLGQILLIASDLLRSRRPRLHVLLHESLRELIARGRSLRG